MIDNDITLFLLRKKVIDGNYFFAKKDMHAMKGTTFIRNYFYTLGKVAINR